MDDSPFVNTLFISPVKFFSFCAAFDSFSSHIMKVLLINPSTVTSIFSAFNIIRVKSFWKYWWVVDRHTYSYDHTSFSNSPSFVDPDPDALSPTFFGNLNLRTSVAFPLLQNADHAIPASTDFIYFHKGYATFQLSLIIVLIGKF